MKNPSMDRFTEARDEFESDADIDRRLEREEEIGDMEMDLADGD